MKKIIFLMMGLFMMCRAHAIPNVWSEGFAQGTLEYAIEDQKGRVLRIACDVGSDLDNSVTLEMNGKNYANTTDNTYPLTFLVDHEVEVTPPASTKWRGGAEAWIQFATYIGKAKHIDVYWKNKKITTFIPLVKSIQKTGKQIATCEAHL